MPRGLIRVCVATKMISSLSKARALSFSKTCWTSCHVNLWRCARMSIWLIAIVHFSRCWIQIWCATWKLVERDKKSNLARLTSLSWIIQWRHLKPSIATEWAWIKSASTLHRTLLCLKGASLETSENVTSMSHSTHRSMQTLALALTQTSTVLRNAISKILDAS